MVRLMQLDYMIYPDASLGPSVQLIEEPAKKQDDPTGKKILYTWLHICPSDSQPSPYWEHGWMGAACLTDASRPQKA